MLKPKARGLETDTFGALFISNINTSSFLRPVILKLLSNKIYFLINIQPLVTRLLLKKLKNPERAVIISKHTDLRSFMLF